MRSAAFLLVFCACKAAPAATTPVSKTPTEVVAGAQKLVEDWQAAWEVRSADKLEALYAQDLDVVVIRQGETHLGWTDVKSHLDDALTRAAAVHLTVEHLSVSTLGEGAASVVCTLTREINDGVSTASERGTLTMALRPEGAGWVIVVEHYSFPPSAM